MRGGTEEEENDAPKDNKRQKEQAVEEEEEEVKIMYLNGRIGRQQAEVVLQIGSEKGAHAVVIAKALEEQTRRPNHGTYHLVWNSKYLSVYTRKDRHVRVEGRGGGTWAWIGGGMAVAYLPPQMNHHELGRALGLMARAHTIIGDFNACGEAKRKSLSILLKWSN